jgi:hypothetical protein
MYIRVDREQPAASRSAPGWDIHLSGQIVRAHLQPLAGRERFHGLEDQQRELAAACFSRIECAISVHRLGYAQKLALLSFYYLLENDCQWYQLTWLLSNQVTPGKRPGLGRNASIACRRGCRT